MRAKGIAVVVWVVLCATPMVMAQVNTIVQWQEGIPETAYTIDQDRATITINEPGGYQFKFYAVDATGEPGTGIIDNVSVADGATGDFEILIQHETGAAGALDWNEGKLTYAGGRSTVIGIKVAGVLSRPIRPVVLDRLDGSIEVGGSVDTLTIEEWLSGFPAKIDVEGNVQEISISGACSGAIFVGADLLELLEIGTDLLGTVHVDGNLVGDLLVQGSLPTPTAGIDVEGDLGPDGMIQIPGLVAGQISIGGDCEGTIWLRVVHESGYIVVKGSVTGAIVFYPLTAYLRGTLDIGGDLLGTILFYWPPGGIYGGRIHIRGSLRNNAPGHEISANYLLDNGAIAIDYDGWDPGDVWETGATVRIGGTIYTGNTPEMNIWEIQRWRGDMNNDGGVNAADNENDLFLTAMHYPEQYAELFPGLEGSRVYHGDCNCDGEFDELDIDPFTFL